jgi:NADH:ubiquinone oxidoreductase subunit 2 (subunit N)
VVVFMLAPADEAVVDKPRLGISTSGVLGVAAVATIALGVFPTTVLDWASHAASLHF